MMKRTMLSLLLLSAVATGVSASVTGTPVKTESPVTILPMPEPELKKVADNLSNKDIIDASFRGKSSRFAALAKKVKGIPAGLQELFAKMYDKGLGRLYTPECLKGHDGRKAAVVVAGTALMVYVCYKLWKKYCADKKQEENPDVAPMRGFCAAGEKSS